MKQPYSLLFLFILSLFTLVTPTIHRRSLHQPLFPVSPSPPSPPPSPPSSTTTDNPFFNQNPNGQTSTPPPAPPSSPTSNATHPIAPQPANKPAKKIAVVISVGLVTLGMLSALAFFIYKYKKNKEQSEETVTSSKIVRGNSYEMNSETTNNLPPSSFLYIGTVEPPRNETLSSNGTSVTNGSPYNKLNSIKTSERYRPSPELQPLPPLKKQMQCLQQPPPPPLDNSSSESSDNELEEEEINDFYTPHGSSASTDDGSSVFSINMKRRVSGTGYLPHSKRTSPKSRLSVSSSPDTLSDKHSHSPVVMASARRAKFAAPPPGTDMTRLHNGGKPPQPPPLPPPDKLGGLPIKSSKSMSPAAKVIPKIVKTTSLPDDLEGEDVDGLRPKLRPLHWDKVKASSDRATVWDQLKSNSFQ